LKEEETMAKRALTGILAIVLVVGAVGWLVGQPATPAPAARKYPTPVPPYPKAKNWTLTVGPDPCQVRETGKDVPVAVIYKEKHSITYQPDPDQPLRIILHAPPDNPTAPAPFRNMTSAGKDEDGSNMWELACDQPKHGCSTGPALKDSKGGYWKTDQILGSKPKCDAGIIIQP
jgi:hypothetical protein